MNHEAPSAPRDVPQPAGERLWRGAGGDGRQALLIVLDTGGVPMRWLICLAVFATLMHSASLTLAQEATPSPTPRLPPEGAVVKTSRDFTRTGTHLIGIGVWHFSFLVIEFDTEAHAEAAASTLIERLADNPRFGNLERTSTTTYRDSTLAYTGKYEETEMYEDEGHLWDAAILIVRDGAILHIWTADGPNADPLFALYAIADTRFADGSGEENTPSTGNIEALLPTLEDLPPGFVLTSEE